MKKLIFIALLLLAGCESMTPVVRSEHNETRRDLKQVIKDIHMVSYASLGATHPVTVQTGMHVDNYKVEQEGNPYDNLMNIGLGLLSLVAGGKTVQVARKKIQQWKEMAPPTKIT